MSLPIPPNITLGQIALDPVNGIVYYKDETGSLVTTSWNWLQTDLTEIKTEDDVTVNKNLVVGGDLVIAGDTVSLNVSEVLIEDNILVLNYNHTGSPILNAGIEVERGSESNVQIRWNELDNKWQFTNDGTTFLDLNSIIENSVTLGTHTTGDYVESITGGVGVTVSVESGESSNPEISIGQAVGTTDSVTFISVDANLTGDVTGNVTGNVTGDVTGDVTGTVSDISNHGISDLSDVNITDPADGNFLRYNGSNWFNDPVNLATDTIGDYVAKLAAGHGITITNNSGEGATPNISVTSTTVVSDTIPTGAQQGDIWYESDSGKTFVYYDSFWVEVSSPTNPQIGTSSFAAIATDLLPSADNQYTLGSEEYRWRSISIGEGTIYITDAVTGDNAALTISNGVFFIDGIAQAQLPNVTVTNLTFADDTVQTTAYIGSNPLGYWGSFSDTSNQLINNAATAFPVKLNTTDGANGVSVENDLSGNKTKITVANAGVYNIQFSLQLDKTDSNDDLVNIWLSKNGTNVPNSNTQVTVLGNNGKYVAAWNFVLELTAGQYVQLMCQSADTNMRIIASGEQSSPARPAVPSAILTVTQVA